MLFIIWTQNVHEVQKGEDNESHAIEIEALSHFYHDTIHKYKNGGAWITTA